MLGGSGSWGITAHALGTSDDPLGTSVGRPTCINTGVGAAETNVNLCKLRRVDIESTRAAAPGGEVHRVPAPTITVLGREPLYSWTPR